MPIHCLPGGISLVYVARLLICLKYTKWDRTVEFVSHRKAVTTHESKETGHYIWYKYVNGILLRFDDTLVNRVDMLSQYHINLILYRQYDIDSHKWEIDLGFVADLNQVRYGLRHPPIHGTRYSLHHRDITED